MLGCFLIPDFLLAISMRTQGLAGEKCVVLLDPRTQSVLGMTPAARRLGVEEGVYHSRARSLCPEAHFICTRADDIEAATSKLLDLFQSVSPTIELAAPGTVLFDLGREEDFGALRREGLALIQKVQKQFLLRGKLGVAATRFVARLAAVEARGGDCVLLQPGEESSFLSAQSVQHLPVAQGIRDKFRLLGIESIGQLQEMEQKNLLRLFGDEAKPLIELARGVDLTPLHGIEVQEVLQETLDMDGVCSIEQVLEGLCVLLEGLFARLKQRHQLCSALRIASLERVLPIRIASPTAEVGRVRGLVREQLQHLHFMDAPERLTLTLEGLVAEYAQQLDFTEASAKRERLVHIQRVVERLEARGRACPLFHVGWLERSSRIPERRAYLQDLKDPCNTRPLLLPKPAQVTVNAEGIPFMLRMRAGWHAVEALVECWDLEDEWWEERPLMRSYYRVYLKNGAIVRLFRDRLNACWYRQSC